MLSIFGVTVVVYFIKILSGSHNNIASNESYLNALAMKSKNGEDTAFMEIIKEFPCLYNRSSAQFKDKKLQIN